MGLLAGGLATAVSLVSQELERQQRLIKEGRNAHLDLAGAQQEAFKNLAGFSKEEQLLLLEDVVPSIQAETGFKSQKDLTLAVGAAGSADAKIEQIPGAVRAAARLTTLKPDEVDEYTMAAVNIGKITQKGPEESLNLLLTAGGKALVKDAGDVAKTLPTAMLNAINETKGNPVENAIEAAALYGLSSDAGGDVTGQSSQTNTAAVEQYLNKLFQTGNKDLNKELETASSKLKSQEDKVSKMQSDASAHAEAEKQLQEKEDQIRKLRLQAADKNASASLNREREHLNEFMQKQPKTQSALEAKQHAISEQREKISRMEQASNAKANLAGSEQELRELRNNLAAQKKNNNIEEAQKELEELRKQKAELEAKQTAIPADPGTLLGRLEMVQTNPQLKSQYLAWDGGVPGEKAFLSSNRDLSDPESKAFKTLLEKKSGIKQGREAYDNIVSQVAEGTLSTRIANADARTIANTEQTQLARYDQSLLGQVRETADKAISENQGWYDAMAESLYNNWATQKLGMAPTITASRLRGTTAAEEAVSGIRELGVLRGNTNDPQSRRRVEEAMNILTDLIVKSAGNLDVGGRKRALTQIDNPGEFVDSPTTVRLLERIENALQGIKATNEEMNVKADRTPSVTGLLSAQQP